MSHEIPEPARSISVVIPAYNEEHTLRRCLAALLADAEPGEFDVLVVANGCSDATAAVARAFAPTVRLAEVAEASKTTALNVGDALSHHFPRVYLDADVEVHANDIREVVQVLRDGPALAAAPQIAVDTSRSSLIVRAYYAIWRRLPYVRSDLVGSGLFALSSEGRARFEEFPDVIADDLFVYSQFAPGERRSIASTRFTIRAPDHLRDLIARRTRVALGNRQLRRRRMQHIAPGHGEWIGVALRDPAVLPALPVFVAITLIARLRAEWRLWRGDLRWERDESTRLPER